MWKSPFGYNFFYPACFSNAIGIRAQVALRYDQALRTQAALAMRESMTQVSPRIQA